MNVICMDISFFHKSNPGFHKKVRIDRAGQLIAAPAHKTPVLMASRAGLVK